LAKHYERRRQSVTGYLSIIPAFAKASAGQSPLNERFGPASAFGYGAASRDEAAN
jgi:hypothetical protein